ncbi:MAG: hypothetical protein KDA79_24435, partial [Planctomycetaceae bacterium]|nr:hypothetical protein [Planctomycetaceae bacterium]
EIITDGFRNAYDFAFTPAGDVFTYDSDGERDVSLPWYRPTRVFHVVPGSHAGWVSRSWKRPGGFFDMPPVLSRLGRGSPTGVLCYRHQQFPPEYQGAAFVLDWTFGRIVAVHPTADGSGFSATDELFMSGAGQHGFAPTDAVVGPDGALYVSVGGRGTRGGVYRVKYTGTASTAGGQKSAVEAPRRLSFDSTDVNQLLTDCLEAPQPLAAWSRAKWVPVARQLGNRILEQAAVDSGRPVVQRIRALEILLELFGGPDVSLLSRLAADNEPQVRARTAWLRGRMRPAVADSRMTSHLLIDSDPLVVRMTLESLAGVDRSLPLHELAEPLAVALDSEDRLVRQTAARVVHRVSEQARQNILTAAARRSSRAELACRLGMVLRASRPQVDAGHLEFGLNLLKSPSSVQDRRDAIRLLQLALGDVGPGQKLPPVYDGYVSPHSFEAVERQLDEARVVTVELYPTGDAETDHELCRLLAMLAPPNRQLLDALLDETGPDSDPVADIHRLLVLSRLPLELTRTQWGQVARVLLRLDSELAARQLP